MLARREGVQPQAWACGRVVGAGAKSTLPKPPRRGEGAGSLIGQRVGNFYFSGLAPSPYPGRDGEGSLRAKLCEVAVPRRVGLGTGIRFVIVNLLFEIGHF